MMRICMVVFSYYPDDPRPRREAEALVDAGDSVDVFCLQDHGQIHRRQIHGVEVHRLPVKRSRGGKLQYLWEYALFLFLSFWVLSWHYLKKRYHIVHVHNMPDALVFSALLPRLAGSKIVLDLHDPMPEVFMTKYGIGRSHPLTKILLWFEMLSIRFAHLVLTPNRAFRELFVARGCPAAKIHVVMNSPDLAVFRPTTQEAEASKESSPFGPPSPRLPDEDRFVIMYHGTVAERHGLKTALEAVALFQEEIPGLRFEVYGDGDYVASFLRLVSEMGLGETVGYHGHVSLEEIASAIDGIDAGIIPNERSVLTEINLPTRIFEYLCMGKPVIAPKTRGIEDYFDESSMFFFEPGDVESLAAQIRIVWRNNERRLSVLQEGMKVHERHCWAAERARFVELLHNLAVESPEA
ncbi:MAG: glycosyltransferase [Candidatus Eisenbacteria bacterium]|nr:glycosyltransferase [Candidatus Eisenbacteria bacterium]